MSYDNRLQNLRDQLGQKGGPSNQDDLRQRIQALRSGHAAKAPSPMPYSGQYESTVGQATNAFNQANTSLAGQRLALQQSYGIGDTSNPYSQARQLEQQRQQQTNATTNSLASSGQLYAGHANDARATDSWNSGVAFDQLFRNYQSDMGNLDQQGINAANDYSGAISQAEAQRLSDALTQPVDPTEAPRNAQQARQRLQAHNRQRNQRGR